ncbi:Kinase, NEK [Giardia lamblia P15]|uniref:Kinase, NEK n=1 Tax=Giardia intestinalis (strain P15) TaxID=658858 RepID=E1F8R5_GIAIA|nr:Kinase, NEK [Giardia lamblia P15]
MDRYHWDLQRLITAHRRTKKPIPKELVFSILEQVADALAYLHNPYKMAADGSSSHGVVYRDLKPANTLMTRDGQRVVLADFGLCKDALHNEGTFAGTPDYMAPETFIRHETSTASDIWAFGVVMYELATMEVPSFSHFWKAEDAKAFFVSGWRPDLRAIEDDFVRTVLEKIFVLDPAERPTARQLCDLLREFNASATGMKLRISALESALEDANARNASLEKALQASSAENKSLEKTVAAQAVEVDFLREGIKRLVARDSSWTPLMCAAFIGDIEMARENLFDKDKRNSDGETALTLAGKMGHGDIVELLDPADADGVTALMRAASRGDAKLVELLVPIQKGMKDKDENTAFMHALKNKQMNTTAALCKYEASSWTPLMCAAFAGNVEMARKNLSDKDKKNDDGETALMLAAKAGHEDIVELLDPTDRGGVTALMWAADRGDVETVRHLIPLQKRRRTTYGWNMREKTALMIAAARGHAEIVRLLVEHEGGMEDFLDWTALMYAAQNGHPECVELLLEKEGGMKDSDEWTALMWAAENGHLDCVRLLVDREREASGWTDLMCAACLGDADAVGNNLQQAGMKNNYGQTALMWAAQNGHLDCVRLLLEKEGGMKSNSGRTALMYAAQNGHAGCVRLLMKKENGMQTINGWTALIVAAYLGKTDCVELLLEKEGRMQDTDGWTALMWATYWNKPECVKLLVRKERNLKSTCEYYGFPPNTTALSIAKKRCYTDIVSIIK